MLLLVCMLHSPTNHLFAQKTAKPNIILILSDDQGHGDVGFHGNPLIQTPNLDQLAGQSTRFTNFYVSPVCAPTRACLMSGQYNLRTGVFDTYRGGAIMATEVRTIAEILQENGYQTGIFGKWHLGDNYPYRPQDQGFQETLIHLGGGLEQPGDFYENFSRKDSSYFDPVLLKNGKPYQSQGYCSDVFTQGAIDFISENTDKPFFVYLAYNAPHTPLEVPQEYYEKYKNLNYNQEAFKTKGNPDIQRMNPKDIEDAKKVYAMVSNLDDNLGKLRAQLTKLKLNKNTVIIFITDNGPQQMRYKSGFYGKKGSVYEGGIHVPSFWYFPKKWGKNREIAQVTAHLDVMPTLLDFLELPIPNNLDGRSVLPLLNKEKASLASRPLFFQWMRGYPQSFHNMAVLTDSLKLTGKYYFEKSPEDFQLFNIQDDPFETKDIKSKYPDLVQKLAKEFQNWQSAMKKSPFLITPNYIPLTVPNEALVVLKRNDWQGPHTDRWGDITALGYWNIEVKESGMYQIKPFFQEVLPESGFMHLKIGTEEHLIKLRQNKSQEFSFENIHLNQGKYRLETWFTRRESNGKRIHYGPFEVKVKYIQ